MNWPHRMQVWLQELSHFPWKNTAATLRERFREDRLGLTAGSLTFTTLMALVPFVAVALAVFTAFPMFGKMQDVLQKWLIESLVPDNIARQVLGYLTQFANKASRLGVAGFAVLLATALALVLTIDRTLNNIWRVQRPRPLAQRVLIYWAVITLGPLLLGASLSLTSWVIATSGGVVGAMPGGVRLLFDVLEFLMLGAAAMALYYYVPNTTVKASHALAGAGFVAVGIELARKLLVLYLGKMPTYSVVYGAFATVPILLVWIYLAWVIVLLGAVMAAYLPSLLAGVARRGSGPGWRFQLALEVLQALHATRHTEARGLSQADLARQLRVDALQIVPVLGLLLELDWVGQLREAEDHEARYVLLAEPDSTVLQPLLKRLLLAPADSTAGVWRAARLDALTLRDALSVQAS